MRQVSEKSDEIGQLGAGRAGQSPRRDSQALCLTSSGRIHVFLCVPLVSQQHISHLFA